MNGVFRSIALTPQTQSWASYNALTMVLEYQELGVD